jgi:hypothetical protein
MESGLDTYTLASKAPGSSLERYGIGTNSIDDEGTLG